jgi:peptidoglycan hydrolase CwlO-like protein
MPKLTVSMLGQKISDLDSEVKYLVQKAKMVKAEQERARRLAEAEALKQAAKEAAAKKKAAADNNETVAEEGGEEEAVPTEAPGILRLAHKKGTCCIQLLGIRSH